MGRSQRGVCLNSVSVLHSFSVFAILPTEHQERFSKNPATEQETVPEGERKALDVRKAMAF